MTVTREEMTLLDLATEDYYNIWDAAWKLAETSISETYDASVARARRVLLSLQSKGLIKFYKYSCQRRDHQEIVADEVTAALNHYVNWVPDDVNNLQFQIKFASTESGNKAYEQLWHSVINHRLPISGAHTMWARLSIILATMSENAEFTRR